MIRLWYIVVLPCLALLPLAILLSVFMEGFAHSRSSFECGDRVYACESGRVIDGDTFEAKCDLGLGVIRQLTVRVAEIDTPEKYGPQREPERGEAATNATIEWLDMRGRRVMLEDQGAGKYGRQIMRVRSLRGEYLDRHLKMKGHEK